MPKDDQHDSVEPDPNEALMANDVRNSTLNAEDDADNAEVARFIQGQESMKSTGQLGKEIRNSRYSHMAGEHGLTLFAGILAIISTCVGGGIVGLPLAFYNLGIPLAIVLQSLVVVATHLSGCLYLAIKDSVPEQPDSLYEIGYILYGRKSIFLLGSIVIVNSFGLCMIYFIVFGDTFADIIGVFTGKDD